MTRTCRDVIRSPHGPRAKDLQWAWPWAHVLQFRIPCTTPRYAQVAGIIVPTGIIWGARVFRAKRLLQPAHAKELGQRMVLQHYIKSALSRVEFLAVWKSKSILPRLPLLQLRLGPQLQLQVLRRWLLLLLLLLLLLSSTTTAIRDPVLNCSSSGSGFHSPRSGESSRSSMTQISCPRQVMTKTTRTVMMFRINSTTNKLIND